MPIIALTDATFVDEVKKPGLIFIDFWASWCAPCRAFAPIFEKVAAKHPDVRFAKVDTDKARAVADALSIRSIPTLMVIREGEVIFAQPGAMGERPLEGLVRWAKEDAKLPAANAQAR